MSSEKRLICSEKSAEGTIAYIIMDVAAERIEKLSYTDTMEMVRQGFIVNAKLENGAIKMLDSAIPRKKLRRTRTDSQEATLFYVFKLSDGMISAISDKGEVFRMSENTAEFFFNENRVLINGTISGKKVSLLKAKNYQAALSRNLGKTYHTHH